MFKLRQLINCQNENVIRDLAKFIFIIFKIRLHWLHNAE